MSRIERVNEKYEKSKVTKYISDIDKGQSKGAYGRLVDKVLKRYQNNILVKLLSVN